MKFPILYSFIRCPYAMRARLALKIADIKCEIREVRLTNKPQHMLRVSPKGTVPVLILKNKIILGSNKNGANPIKINLNTKKKKK